MKTIKLILTVFFISIFINVNAQSEKQIEKEKNKVKLFSEEEYSNLHLWFYNQLEEMNMTEKVENQYYSYLSMYTVRMSRLDDKDKDYSKKEITEKFNALVIQLNNDLKPILNTKQNNKHLEIMKIVSRTILNKLKIVS